MHAAKYAHVHAHADARLTRARVFELFHVQAYGAITIIKEENACVVKCQLSSLLTLTVQFPDMIDVSVAVFRVIFHFLARSPARPSDGFSDFSSYS